MSTLRVSPVLGRPIRQDRPVDLGRPTRALLNNARTEGKTAEAQNYLDYLFAEHAIIRQLNTVFVWHLVRYVLDRRGDEFWRTLLVETMSPWIATTAGLAHPGTATVEANGQGARLTADGQDFELAEELVDEGGRYDIAIGSLDDQLRRWTRRRESLAALLDQPASQEFPAILSEQLREEMIVHDFYGDWAWSLMSFICRTWGEDGFGEVLRVTQEPWLKPRYERVGLMTAEESLQLAVEGMRGHFAGPGRSGEVTVHDEPERYVMSFDACGSGGRMRRGDAVVGSPSRLGPPYNFLNIAGAYPWTWNRKGVCAYCTHCAMALQILPIEQMGHPMRVTEYPENPSDPCRWIICKSPELVPDEAYAAVGKKPGEGAR